MTDKKSLSAEPTRKSTTRQALYRNWRPRSFKELVGQEHVTKTLENAIKSGRISHAYLFTGPRGVGKTSAARILAHLANNFPYTGEETHLDIIEIDAASNRRIDEIRELRDKVAIAPVAGKYKVYIIDEVHMLTREAFNALLKTLEEPPAHTIFILATTEAHKLPETIISRTQRFEFKPLAGPQMAKHLQKIAKNEGIKITPEALNLLAEFGGGSFRDSISYLDQLSTLGSQITEEDVRLVLGMPPTKLINEIVGQIINSNAAGLINSVASLKEAGVDASAAAASIAKAIRDLTVSKGTNPKLINLLKDLIETPASSRPYDFLEVSLLQAAADEATIAKNHDLKPKTVASQPTADKKSQAAQISPPVQQIQKPKKTNVTIFDISVWPQIVEASKQRAASLYTALRLAEPAIEDGNLILKFEFPLHQKKLTQSKNKALVEDLINEITGQVVSIDSIVDKSAFKIPRPKINSSATHTESENPINSISSIFGQAEVMET